MQKIIQNIKNQLFSVYKSNADRMQAALLPDVPCEIGLHVEVLGVTPLQFDRMQAACTIVLRLHAKKSNDGILHRE